MQHTRLEMPFGYLEQAFPLGLNRPSPWDEILSTSGLSLQFSAVKLSANVIANTTWEPQKVRGPYLFIIIYIHVHIYDHLCICVYVYIYI